MAKELWQNKGYIYQESTWDQIPNKKQWTDVEVLIVRLQKKVGPKELDFFPKLKYLVSATTGRDHLDLAALANRNVELISLRGQDEFLSTIPSTAEHTWALIMALIRKVPASAADVKSGNWNRDDFRGYQLANKTLGIIGLGRTGLKVAGFAAAFDMQIQFYDPFKDSIEYVKVDSIEELLGTSDIVSIHVHLDESTRYLINQKNILNTKQGSYLINTSRANIWDENAIVSAVESGHLSGIATDVIVSELSKIDESPIWRASKKNDNILITPHLGGATWDAMWACEEFIIGLFD